MHLRRTREEFVKSIQGTLQGKEHELESRNQIMTEEWKRQDEELGRKRQVSLSLSLTLKGLILYTSGVLFHVECCIRYTASSSVLLPYSIISLASHITIILISTLF